jgi:hypothetical protein
MLIRKTPISWKAVLTTPSFPQEGWVQRRMRMRKTAKTLVMVVLYCPANSINDVIGNAPGVMPRAGKGLMARTAWIFTDK